MLLLLLLIIIIIILNIIIALVILAIIIPLRLAVADHLDVRGGPGACSNLLNAHTSALIHCNCLLAVCFNNIILSMVS